MVYIFTDFSSTRLDYVLKVIFNSILKTEYKLVPWDEFLKLNNGEARINYSHKILNEVVNIVPHDILKETEIISQKIDIEWLKGNPFFFRTSESSVFNFDLFACAFYMLSRYEEYLEFIPDKHGRFRAEESLAFKNNFLELPVVNIWAGLLKEEIQNRCLSVAFSKLNYNYINTFDIDVAYKYKGKKNRLIILSSLRSLLLGNKTDIKDRWNYFFNNSLDSYDVYEYIEKIRKKYKSKHIFFFQMGRYGKYDKSLSQKSSAFKKLIKSIQLTTDIGIHPSYKSNSNNKLLVKEIGHLETILEKKVVLSRQHFLKMTFPETFESLIDEGIQHDFTMGFASQIGFRAGICSAFPFFNLQKNEERNLEITPFQIMDGTLHDYLKLTPKESIEKIQLIVAEIRKVNGTFVSLWHNSSLCEQDGWQYWRPVYEELQKIAIDK
jgi:hypothetical protein